MGLSADNAAAGTGPRSIAWQLRVEGALDAAGALRLGRLIDAMPHGLPAGDVAVDCSAVSLVAAAGLGALLRARRTLRTRCRRMVLQGVPVHLSELLATTGVASLFGDGTRSHPPLPNDGTERWASLLNAPRT